ncbi:MAG: SLC13 family permease [Bilophila wadsworthia]
MTLPMTGKNCSLALKWLISFAIPLIVYWAMPIDGQTVTHHMALFLSITTWAICIWAMDAMNEIAVGLILPVLYIVLCGVKQQVVYSPWLSEVPLIVIGGFALGKILQETGLGKRIGLTCVRCMGGSFTADIITLAVSIVAPLVRPSSKALSSAPSASACDALDFKAAKPPPSSLLLPRRGVDQTVLPHGRRGRVLGMGLLQKASGISSTWMEYAMHNFLPGMLYTFMSVGLVMLILPSKVDRQALRATLQIKYQELGPVTSEQKRAAILMLVTLILLATDKLHGVAAGLVLIGVTFAAFLPGVRLLDGPKFSKVNFAPLFFIMGCMTIGSAGGFLKVTTWIANNTLPYLHGMTTTTAGLASYVLGALANFLLTPLAATTTMTSPVTELGIQMNMDPRILFYSFQYGLDNYLFPYEYAVILYFFSSGYMLFKDMLKVLAARMVLTGIFLFFLAIPYWKMVL